MALSTTAENYLKALYLLQQRQGGKAPVPMGRFAEAVSVTPGTATTMVKRFDADGLMTYTPRKGVRLSPRGKKLALHVLRRHRIIETFLVQVLGLDWSEVHQEAEVLEHAVSDKVLDKLDALLGHPTADPHGSPIPPGPGRGATHTVNMRPLTDCTAGEKIKIGRLLDTDAPFLQFAERRGLIPGQPATVLSLEPAADAITLRLAGGKQTTLGSTAAGKILIADT